MANKVGPDGIDGHHDFSDSSEDSAINSSDASFENEVFKKYGHHVSKKSEDPKATELRKRKEVLNQMGRFWRLFTAVLFSPIFLRHRNLFFLGVEVFAPGLVIFVIFAAFTSGISWKQARHSERQAYSRLLNYPELTMDAAMRKFKDVHADSGGRTLILYTPVTDLTSLIMENTMEQLGLDEHNRIFKHGQGASGVVGIETEVEMFEHAMFHREDRYAHGKPAAVVFKIDYNDKSAITNMPYAINFSISLFDDNIKQTADTWPFIEPADTEQWESPYVTSGFIGLQYAIEQSIIRTVLDKQRQVEVKELHNDLSSDGAKERSETRGDYHLTSEIDEDLFEFLKGESVDLADDDSDEDDGDQSGGRGRNGEEPGPKMVEHFTREGVPQMHRRLIKTSHELPQRTLKMFTYNMFGTEDYRKLLTFVLTFSLVISYSFMSFFIVQQIARENSSGIKDLLQMHGLPHSMHWTMLLLHAFIFRGMTTIMVVVALKVDMGNGSIINFCETEVLFCVIYVHQLALTFLNFFIAIYVRTAKWAGLLTVVTGILSFYMPDKFFEMSLVGYYTEYMLAIIFPNWCLRQVLRCMIDHEVDEKGIKWWNLFKVAHLDTNTLSVGGGLLRMLFIGTVYYCLAAYIDMSFASRLFPQTYKWYQFAEKRKERKQRMLLHEKLVHDIDEGVFLSTFERPPVYEEPRKDQKSFVQIRNICKSFGKHKLALDSINMDIFHEEVTVILGSSGSGKSTLMSILAGLVQPSDGYAIVKGFDVQFDAMKAREYMGMCPQRLVSFNLLTVREHIKLCYRLRGYTSAECEHQVATLLTKLRLWNVRSFLPNNLTNDELRRLGMAMALADTPKVLLLDEPTQGMDSMGRKEVWDIIQTLKRHHTIVLTTNYMDEAEHLADRLVFLSHGRLICCGTLPFLREQYETGYFLHIFPLANLRLDAKTILNLVKKKMANDNITIRDHKRISEVDTLVLGMPFSIKSKFPELCDELEGKLKALNISRFTIRKVSLNDIFIRICSSVANEGSAVNLYVRRDTEGDIKSSLFAEIPKVEQTQAKKEHEDEYDHYGMEEGEMPGPKVTSKEFFISLLRKRWAVIKSGGYSIAFHFIIPTIFMWMVVFQARLFVSTTSEHPQREMVVNDFNGRNLQLLYRMGVDDLAINYSSHLSRILSPYGVELDRTDRIITKMYEVLNGDQSERGYEKDDHMVAFEFRKLGSKNFDLYDFVGYFASGAMHSPPVVVNLMSNTYLSVVSAAEWRSNLVGRRYLTSVTNDPMPSVRKGMFEDGCGVTCILLALLMSCSIAFVSHYCIQLPIMERYTGMKHLQLMCGVPHAIYWIADFVVDVVIMFGMSFVIIIVFLADVAHTFYSTSLIFTLWLVCILYLCWSGLMYAYFMSSVIPPHTNGYNVLAVLHICLGTIPYIFFTFASPEDTIGIFWKNFFEVFFPPYTITSLFHNFFNLAGQINICRGTNPYLQEICDVRSLPHDHTTHNGHYISERELYKEISDIDSSLAKCCDRICLPSNSCFTPPAIFNSSNESWESPGIITDTIALFVQGLIYCGLLIMSDKRMVARLMQRVVLRILQVREKHDTIPKRFREVRHESLMVRSILDEETFPADTALVCVDLTKSSTAKMIIKDFCMEVKKGQCVAILGRGNAGKSTIIKMIVGETLPTQGNCYINGNSLIHHRKEYLSNIGYCPQQNCLYPQLTGAQMLELMGRLRGISQNVLNTHVVKWLRIVGLSEVAHEKCGEYGDGMKQKLRAAMAFIGGPNIILLDEPTAKVDPSSRERVWSLLEHLNQLGHTIIFTTFSTEEAFSLASKVIVIAEGCVQSIGDPEKIKRQYGRGYTLLFKLRHDVLSTVEIMSVTEGRVSAFKDTVHETYKHIDLLDEQDEMVMFFLRDARLSWGEVLRRALYLATVHSDIIEYYEVSEGEIDDIFVFLTNKFHELGTPRKSEPLEIGTVSKKDAELKDLRNAEKHLKNSGF